MEDDITKKYSNEDITIVWKPKVCIHSAICFKGLPAVFNPKKRPWVTIEGSSSKEIMAQIEILPNGPILVYGTIEVKDKAGNKTLKNNTTAFCRCGHSGNKPFCDGSHVKKEFQG